LADGEGIGDLAVAIMTAATGRVCGVNVWESSRSKVRM
jgi:hypothetical protein